MTKSNKVFTEDTTAITNSVATAYGNYVESQSTVRVTDLIINNYNGNKSALAQELAGTNDKKSTAYKSQMKAIGRWLAFESGETNKKKIRNPNGKATQSKLKGLVARKTPPHKATITMSGYVYYDAGKDARYRRIPANGDIQLSGNALATFIKAMNDGDTHAAYQEVWAQYGGATDLELAEGSDTEFNISFDGADIGTGSGSGSGSGSDDTGWNDIPVQ